MSVITKEPIVQSKVKSLHVIQCPSVHIWNSFHRNFINNIIEI